MLAELSGFQLWLMHWILPGLIGAILAFIPLIMVIKALHKLLDDLILANADNKISKEEYDQICVDIGELKNSIISLLKIFIKNTPIKLERKSS